MLKQISDFFNTSIDYLLGETDDPSPKKKQGQRTLQLKEARERAGLSQKELAHMIAVSPSRYNQWETGKYSPDTEMLILIAETLNTTVDYLIGATSYSGAKAKGHRIPVLGTVAAGIPLDAIEDIIDWEEIDPDLLKDGSEYVALQIHGDSMLPRMANGDIVIVRIQEDCISGDIAIVIVNGDQATCKKIKKTPEGVMLIPLNPAFETMFYSNDEIEKLPVRILGKVVELRAKF